MEKRFILAFILSFFVLYFWTGMSQQPTNKKVNVSQTIENKELMVFPAVEEISQLPAVFPPAPLNEQIKTVKTQKLTVDFSNVGGLIKRIHLNDYNVDLPVDNYLNLSGYGDVEFKQLIQKSDNEISFIFEDSANKIVKTYVLGLGYDIDATVQIYKMSNLDRQKISAIYLDMTRMDNKHPDAHEFSLFEYVISSISEIKRKNNANKFSESERLEKAGVVEWVGFRNRYFCSIVKPGFMVDGYSINPISEKELSIDLPINSKVLAEQNNILSFKIYAGPEDLDNLKEYGAGFEKIRRYYKLSIFDAVAKLIYNILALLHKVVPNWGICIILIGTIIYFGTYPLTLSSMSSMKKMQSLQPKVAQLKEKYKNNPQKMNQEMMALYKDQKINPLSGCLPMLLQMPVFIGLYQVLWRSVSLNGAKFLWIKDLSQPDRLFRIGLPGVEYFNILPLIMVVIMFLQQKLTSKNMVFTDPMQESQQKMMTFFMPIMLGFVFYNFASGLTLYFTMFYLFSTFTQWKMLKSTKSA